MSLACIENLSYRYPGADGALALDNVSVELGPGEMVVVAGASGSGKSTLLRALSGLVPHFYGGTASGRVTVTGLDTREHGPGELAAHVGTLFQDPETQIVLGTVRAELAFPVENRGWSDASVARAVEETALALAIDQLLDRPTAQLSGGELQRTALGATLTGRPRLVCLDEPTSQLDPVAGDELISLLRRLNEDTDVTVLLSEHRLERCLPLADRVLAMEAGKLVFDGAPHAFLAWAVDHAPALVTPGSRLLDGLGLAPVPGVRRARAALRDAGLLPPVHDGPVGTAGAAPQITARLPSTDRPRRRDRAQAAIQFRGVWHEIHKGPAILCGVDFTAMPGERIALMGRNGAGKSTFLRHAAGLMQPTRGTLSASGRVGLLLQNPTDYLIHDTVADEAPLSALRRFGLDHLAERHPRELSGGEKQRLALAIVLGDPTASEQPAVICLDEPTRGMDRHNKETLIDLLSRLDAAVIVATHDPEFAASIADRVVLLGDGQLIADGPAQEILAGGTYFATETARIIGGAAAPLLPADALLLLRGPVSGADRIEHPVSQVAS